jgi:uncharacterized damage-inducible protein DinB
VSDGMSVMYDWVRQTRDPLIAALSALGPERYQAPQATLAGDSVRDRHLHIAQCYIYWVARVGLGENIPDPRPEDFADAQSARAAFTTADGAVARMLERFAGRMDEVIERRSGEYVGEFTPRWLLSHPITHEFNHKGQIIVVVRMFGVDPGDTDLVYPFKSWPA